MTKKMIDKATIEALKAKFKEAPKLERAEVITPVMAVMAMSKEIKEMQAKGYTLAKILDDLKSSGIEVGLSTLKKALKDAEVKSVKRTRSTRAKAVQQDLLDTATTEAKETAEEAKTEAKETVKNLSDSTQEVTEEAKRKAEVLARLSQRRG